MPDKSSRPDFQSYCINMLKVVSSRSTCRHRDCGAIIVKNKHIVSTGYNGAPAGMIDCLELGYCTKNDKHLPCLASGVHAESNAILSAARFGISTDGATMYSRYSPCKTCASMIKASGIVQVYYEEEYTSERDGIKYLESLGVAVEQIIL